MVRPATKNDIPALLEMMRLMQQESEYRELEFSVGRATEKLVELIGWGFVVIAEQDGVIIGGMLGDTSMQLWSEDLIGLDYGLYVRPGRRGGIMAARMVREFEKWCEVMGVKQIRPAVSTANALAGKLYRGLGYQPVGEQFLKGV
jgi:GNAT superfamily N-acetyltransferase